MHTLKLFTKTTLLIMVLTHQNSYATLCSLCNKNESYGQTYCAKCHENIQFPNLHQIRQPYRPYLHPPQVNNPHRPPAFPFIYPSYPVKVEIPSHCQEPLVSTHQNSNYLIQEDLESLTSRLQTLFQTANSSNSQSDWQKLFTFCQKSIPAESLKSLRFTFFSGWSLLKVAEQCRGTPKCY